MKTDSQLQADVLEALRADEHIVASDIGVSARDGVVTLSGEVDSLTKRVAAGRAAEHVRGVRSIANELAVRLPQDRRRTDADIADDVVNALVWDTEVPDKTIKARVQDRWVWLVGEADWHYQRLAAERAVESIAGVKGVTNLVRIKWRTPDPELQAAIEAALLRNAELAMQDIRVSVVNGAVTLSGVVRSWADRMAAEHVVWSAAGVTEVDNQLEIAA
jgi:osmotically-inducible protein OsmY